MENCSIPRWRTNIVGLENKKVKLEEAKFIRTHKQATKQKGRGDCNLGNTEIKVTHKKYFLREHIHSHMMLGPVGHPSAEALHGRQPHVHEGAKIQD